MSVSFPDLRGASVFITGGGSGIGAALTEGFAAQGARVAFVQRSAAEDLCDAIAERHGIRPLYIPCDVADPQALRSAVAQAKDANGPVQVLVANAANDHRQPTLDITESDWDAALDINLRHYFVAAQAVIPDMQAAGAGAIVNMSSISYMMGLGGLVPYTCSNAAITAMTRSLARDFGPDGIRANTIAPGMVVTPRQLDKWLTPESMDRHLERQCLKQHLEPADIVEPALFLASQASAMITGQCINVDGGTVFSG